MLQAVHSGEISRERLDHSVLKILRTKASLNLQEARTVDVRAISNLIAKPENLAFGQQVANDAVTWVRDNGKVLPLKSSLKNEGTAKAALPYTTQEETHNQVLAVIVSDDMRTESGHAFGREFHARIPDARLIYVDPRVAAGMSGDVLKAVDEASTVIAAVYVIPTAGKMGNGVAMADATGALLQQVLDHAAAKTAVVAMGNPYLAADFPKIENYMCTFSNATVSEIAAVRALFGEIAIRGHLPVSSPNVAARGTGMERPVQVSSGGTQHAQK
jgi:beta-N-acetylhexosaminidase